MYDDQTFDNIINEMLSEFGIDVRTDEGSLAYNACAKIAEKLEDVYGEMDFINENMSPDTMDLEHLITYAQTQRGIMFEYAEAPVVKGDFMQEIELGQQFYCNDYTYTVTEHIAGYSYKLVCDTEGVEANTNFGALEPVDYIDDYQGGQLTELLAPGADDEGVEVFRARVLASFQNLSFCGNKADYRKEVNALQGVGGCKPRRREKDSAWVVITIISDTYDVPNSSIVAAVQDAIDPEQSHGEGDGLAPICHNVRINPVEAVPVSIETTLTFDVGYSADVLQAKLNEAVQSYLLGLRQRWEANEFNDLQVRVAQIEAKLLLVDGVLDIKDTTLNGAAGNLVLAYAQIPTFGGVTVV